MNSTQARIVLYLLLTSLFVSVSVAQETSAASSAPEAKSISPEHVIIKVGGQQVSREDFESGVGNFETEDADSPAHKDRRKLGDDYASVLMLSQQALADHLDTTPEMRRQLAIDRIQILSNAQFQKMMDQAKPSPEAIGKYYTDHLADYDQVNLTRLFIWKRHDPKGPGLPAADARSRANAILKASAAGNNAEATKLAEAFKTSKDALLDMAPTIFPRGELAPQMEKVAFALKQGDWGEAEDSPDRIALINLVKRDRRDLQYVSSLIEQRLQAQNMQAAIDKMKKNAGIWLDGEYFGTEAPAPGADMRGPSPPPQGQKSAKPKQEKSNGEDYK